MTARYDPIGDRYFKPLLQSERTIEVLFYGTAILSLAALLVSKVQFPVLYDLVQIAFVLCVIANGVLTFVSRVYLSPRATDKRRQDLLSDAFSVPLTHDTSTGYYNNEETNPFRRLATSTMESAFFSEAILRKMLFAERSKISIYALAWLVATLTRSTDLGIVAIAAQVVFGEQTLSKWLRTEWLRSRSENAFEQLRGLLMNGRAATAATLQAQSLELYSHYESSKAVAGVSLSSRVFGSMNAELSAEWDRIRADLAP